MRRSSRPADTKRSGPRSVRSVDGCRYFSSACATAAPGAANTSVGVARNASAVSGRCPRRCSVSASTAALTRTLVAPSA
ncbi:hypothetical protein ACFQZ4_38985 [Catellatospora coxensis]